MRFFLDSAHVEQIEQAQRLGILDGVTTNPSHVASTGRPFLELYKEICAMVDGPVSLECISLKAEEIVAEAKKLVKIGDNVVIKVPLMKEGLIAVKELEAMGIPTNVTTVFSAAQALLAAKCNATYVSPFIGRLDAIGHDGIDIVSQIKTIYNQYGYDTQIIVASVRDPQHVLDCALLGADIATMGLDVISLLYNHPLTDLGIERFLKDWEKVPK